MELKEGEEVVLVRRDCDCELCCFGSVDASECTQCEQGMYYEVQTVLKDKGETDNG